MRLLARWRCSASAGSPARRSATQAFTVAFSSAGPPTKYSIRRRATGVRERIGQLGNFLGFRLAKDVQVENVVGFEGGIGFEFAPPIPLWSWVDKNQSTDLRRA